MGHGRTCGNAESNDEQSIFHRRRALARNENVWISLKCGKNREPLPNRFALIRRGPLNEENPWNTRDPQRVARAYTTDCRWRNRAEFLQEDRKSTRLNSS